MFKIGESLWSSLPTFLDNLKIIHLHLRQITNPSSLNLSIVWPVCLSRGIAPDTLTLRSGIPSSSGFRVARTIDENELLWLTPLDMYAIAPRIFAERANSNAMPYDM